MKHQIKAKQYFGVLLIAEALEGNERKDIRLVHEAGKLSYVARHFKAGKLIAASRRLTDFEQAVDVYNGF